MRFFPQLLCLVGMLTVSSMAYSTAFFIDPVELSNSINDKITVVDGDTIKVNGERMRLLDIDAPEIFHPRCDNEKKKGELSKQYLQVLVNAYGSDVKIESSGHRDRYGRPLIHLVSNGRDIGQFLLDEGLAVQWKPGKKAWHSRAAHWCG